MNNNNNNNIDHNDNGPPLSEVGMVAGGDARAAHPLRVAASELL